VVAPKEVTSGIPLELNASVLALEEAKIYPRISGYVRRWLVDIGDKVEAGQLLAEIDAPETVAQLAQARAQLAQARAAVQQALAQREYSSKSSTRYEALAGQQLVAQAQVEQTQAQAKTDEASLAAAQANVAAQESNVHRLEALVGYMRVVAPFAGKITQRLVSRGDAVVADLANTAMFTVAATDPVRVIVNAPQVVVPVLAPGIDAQILVREYPGRTFAGKITRISGALDSTYRLMPIEIRIPNPDDVLLPGMYVTARVQLPTPHRVLEIPVTALYSDAQGVRVAAVDDQHRIHYLPITIERDTGASLLVSTGLTGTEKIVKIANPTLAEGDPVEIATTH
jgi:RND family efflux transporter MFP subunit